MPALSKQGDTTIETQRDVRSNRAVTPVRLLPCEDCDRRFYGFVWPTGKMQSHGETLR
jgi:hypothetical protein